MLSEVYFVYLKGDHTLYNPTMIRLQSDFIPTDLLVFLSLGWWLFLSTVSPIEAWFPSDRRLNRKDLTCL